MVLEGCSQFSVNGLLPANIAVDQELNAKDGIEIDRRLWRNLARLAVYLANKRGHHLIENYLSVDANDLTMI